MSSRMLLLLFITLAPGCASQSEDLTSGPEEHVTQPNALQDPGPVDLPAVEADKLIADMLQLMTSAHGFRVNGTLWQVGLTDDGRYLPGAQSPERGRTFRVEKPNKLLNIPGAEIGPTILSDGKELIVYVPTFEKALLREPAPASAMALLQHPELGILGHPMMFFPFHFASDEAVDAMFGSKFEKDVLGGEEIAGQPAYHVALKSSGENGQGGFSWHVWIAATGRPFPLQIRFDLGKRMVELPGRSPTEMNVALVDRYFNWEIDPPDSPGEFEFKAPKDARPVLSLYERSSPLVGKPAPAFSLEKLTGGTASLAAHAGKDVVVLDFWASWCEPCVEAMPYVDRVAKDYEGRGAVFYSVNLGDPKEVVEKFLEKVKIDMVVLVDPAQRVGQQYGAPPIPLLVIIDRNGVIRGVNQGFDTGLEGALRKQLDAYIGQPASDKSTSQPPVEQSSSRDVPNP